MTAGLSKVILPICKRTSRANIWEGKQPRINYIMHCINSKKSKKERIGAIDQGFTCLFPFATTQSAPLLSQRSSNDGTSNSTVTGNTNHTTINKIVHQTFLKF
jgi:hypothetical protein